MKKTFKFIFVLVLCLFIAGCKEKEVEDEVSEETLTAWVDTVIPELITKNITLPTTYPKLGGLVVWNTNSENFDYDGKYTRPAVTEPVEITVQITIGGKTYNIVKNTFVDGDKSAIDFIANWFANKVKTNRINGDITTSIYPVTHPVYGGEIAWTSSNEAVLKNDGTYLRPADDVTVTINFTVTFQGETKSYSEDAIVNGVPATLKFNEAKNWIATQMPSGELTEDDILPIKYDPYDITITWSAFGSSIVSLDGQIKRPLYDMKASLTATLTLPTTVQMTVTYDCIIQGENKVFENQWEAVELFLSKIEKQTVTNLKYYSYGFEAGYEKMENTCFGYIPFFTEPMYEYYEDILEVSTHVRPGTLKPSTEFITVHDTATATGGETHHNTYLKNLTASSLGGNPDTRYVSWHYTCGPDKIYHHVPDNEVAYHAGDGARFFELLDTGIKATTKIPVIGITTNGYFTFNGEKTNILAPTADGVILNSAKILPGGIHVEIGANGNYFMNKTYYNSSFGGNICNHGGNRNSIGIESTMEVGKDYTKTMRNLAKLVAKLCFENNLAIDRVKQHWHFSGKDCPRTIRASGRWQEFLELVSLELFALNYLEGVTFTWTSLSPTILDNYGKIIDHPGGTPTVSYKVAVKVGSETREYTQSATLAEKATTFTDLDWVVPA